jgi:hypothetical protein
MLTILKRKRGAAHGMRAHSAPGHVGAENRRLRSVRSACAQPVHRLPTVKLLG